MHNDQVALTVNRYDNKRIITSAGTRLSKKNYVIVTYQFECHMVVKKRLSASTWMFKFFVQSVVASQLILIFRQYHFSTTSSLYHALLLSSAGMAQFPADCE